MGEILKRCTKCGEEKPATREFFYWDSYRSSLHSYCKNCQIQCAQARQKKMAEQKKQERLLVPPLEPAPTRCCTKCSEEKPATKEFFYTSKQSKSGLHPHCKECFKAQVYARREADPERAREISRASWGKRREKENARKIARYHERMATDPEWAAKERERQKEKAKKEREENPQRALERTTAWRRRNIDRFRANQRVAKKKAYAQDPEKFKARAHKGRAKRLSASGEFTGQDLSAAFKRQGGKCLYCECKIVWRQTRWHADHFIPISRGGTNDPSNIVIACQTCNLSKHDKMPWDFMPDKFQPPQE